VQEICTNDGVLTWRIPKFGNAKFKIHCSFLEFLYVEIMPLILFGREERKLHGLCTIAKNVQCVGNIYGKRRDTIFKALVNRLLSIVNSAPGISEPSQADTAPASYNSTREKKAS
jgi:hypothetical protein